MNYINLYVYVKLISAVWGLFFCTFLLSQQILQAVYCDVLHARINLDFRRNLATLVNFFRDFIFLNQVILETKSCDFCAKVTDQSLVTIVSQQPINDHYYLSNPQTPFYFKSRRNYLT